MRQQFAQWLIEGTVAPFDYMRVDWILVRNEPQLCTNMPPHICLCRRKYQVVFCYTIIERNNRQVLPVVHSSAGGDSVTTNTNPLDSFFPFDPYLLKRYTADGSLE